MEERILALGSKDPFLQGVLLQPLRGLWAGIFAGKLPLVLLAFDLLKLFQKFFARLLEHVLDEGIELL